MSESDELKSRQLYVKFTDREWEKLKGMLEYYRTSQATFLRKLILSTMKKMALMEREKEKGK